MEDSDGSVAGGSNSEFEYEDNGDLDINSEGDQVDEEMIIEEPEVRKAPYLVMNRAELAARQKKSLMEAGDLLQVSQEESFVLLRPYGWDITRLQEAWFEDERKVRERCGLLYTGFTPSASSSSGTGESHATCPICMSLTGGLVSLGCGHGFCRDCWSGYLHSQVDDGKSSVATKCPQHKCNAAVPMKWFSDFCDTERRDKYQEWCLKAFVDENSSIKWCSNPVGCQFAVEYQGVDAIEIRCNCSFSWCWACGEESHKPASCGTVNNWNIKNSAESENISWIRANTKKCPKCHKPIEKNQGCNHMVCSKAGGCGHEFCWLCLGEWATHGTSTGGYYQCNIYDKQSKEGKHSDEEKTRKDARHALDKYMFYFERYMNHDKAMKLTVTQEQQIEGKVQTLHKRGFEIIELQFLYDALRQVRVCRQVLKWTYVYGYYLEDSIEKPLFEHLQKHLEEKTDCLHEMLERDFEQFFFSDETMSAAGATAKFMEFRSHATNFTNVTQKFLAQLLTDIGSETGLGEKKSRAATF